MTEHFLSIVGGVLTAFLGYFSGMFAEVQQAVPPELWHGGSTAIMLSGMGYAVIHLWRALRMEQRDRLADRESHLKELKAQLEQSAKSGELLAERLETLASRIVHMESGDTRPVRVREKREDDA